MKLYKTTRGVLLETDGGFFAVAQSIDDLLSTEHLDVVLDIAASGPQVAAPLPQEILAPVGTQEIWASGVTYFRSRNARMEESKDAGGGTFYDRVYSAERPELFFKANGHAVVGPSGQVRIRRDAAWSVPEPELVLVINASGHIVGFTVGNDMSSRDIEGENPLYLPQAKVYDGSCAIGPCILLASSISSDTAIHIRIMRDGHTAFEGKTALAELKRTPEELAGYLYRENTFTVGAFLFTGTGIVPPDDFTLAPEDTILITIDGIGTLENTVA
jgi:2-dehydro-3-deoxy-D-arabinonate dehydratase